MSSGIGTLATETHWLRMVKAYGSPPRALFVVQTWWPVSDPNPNPGVA